MKIKFKMVALSFALIGVLLLSACHTVGGFGEDVEHGGRAIERAAN
jgi:predicted small secreted protein